MITGQKLPVYITKSGLEDLTKRAARGDIDATCALGAFNYIVLSDEDAKEFGL